MKYHRLFMLSWLFVICLTGCARIPFHFSHKYKPAPENLEARAWFQDAKFGLFIHWGIYSTLEKGAGVMDWDKMSAADYEKIPGQFQPKKFDAETWVALAKFAGVRYITITAKHHDGFAMFNSKKSDWDVVDRCPEGKDIIKALAQECNRQGIKLFVYYSQLDWHHPDYYPRGATGLATGRPDKGKWKRYLDDMDTQVKELFTHYGPLGGVWFDGMWDKPNADWNLRRTYNMIHKLQPQALIGNNHHKTPAEGEDFQIFEKDLPGEATQQYNKGVKITGLPLESCDTINKSWAYNKSDTDYKSTRDLLRRLIGAAGRNSNFLLDVGPRPDGTIQPEFIQRLREMGNWLEVFGESIFGTRGGPLPPGDWGVSTHKNDNIYLHYLNEKGGRLTVSQSIGNVESAYLFSTGQTIDFYPAGPNYIINIPERVLDPVDTIIVLEMEPKKGEPLP